MAPAGHQGHPKATIGTPKGDRVEHDNWTTPSMEEDRIDYSLNWVTRTGGLSYNWWFVEVGGFGWLKKISQGVPAPPIVNLQSGLVYCNFSLSK